MRVLVLVLVRVRETERERREGYTRQFDGRFILKICIWTSLKL